MAEGAVAAGIEKLREIHSAEVAVDPHLADWLAAGAYLNARRVVEGTAMVEQAIARIAAGGSRMFESDLHRMKGELALMAADALDAEAAFNTAILIAHRQKAKSFELRAALSLARLLAQKSRRDEAHSMLSEIYNWFTEGFDTRDLQEAKQLLNELDQES